MKYIIPLLMLLVLPACKTTLPDGHLQNKNISETLLLNGYSILGRRINDSDLPEENILEISPELESLLQEELKNTHGNDQKAKALSRFIFSEDKLAMEYDAGLTYTALDTFNKRMGNCLSFSYLYFALAQIIGLDAEFQEIHIMPEWDYTDDKIYVESKHVNIRVNLRGADLIIDIDEVTPEKRLDYTLLDKAHVEALYYGNVGAEHLLSGDSKTAFKYFVKAIKVDPDNPTYWSNLGVLYRRAGFDEFAEMSYFKALSLKIDDQATLNNLSFMYSENGDQEKADFYGDLVKKYQSKNPYFRYVRAQKAMADNLLDLAMDHINYAIRKKENEPRFHILQSQIYQELGKTRDARKALRKAEELSVGAD